MPEHVLAIDVGGTAVKAAVYDLRGRECAVAGEAMRPLSPHPGWVERDQDAVWRLVCRCVRSVMAQAGFGAADIAAIGLTGTGNGLFLLDADRRPVRNGVLSSDQRAAAVVDRWKAEGREPGHIALTGQRLWAGKPLPLLTWLAEHEPHVLARAAHAMMPKDELRLRLTGRLAQEVTDASTASLIDQRQRRWSPSVFAHFGLADLANLLPDVIESLGPPDPLMADAAAELGLRVSTPVAAGSADGHAMLLALGVLDDRLLHVVAGTWGLNQLATQTPTMDGSILASTLGCRPGHHVLIDGAPTSASSFEWLVDRVIGPARDPADRTGLYAWCDAQVAALNDADPPIVFLPFLNGAVDDADARGTFVGLSSWHHLGHLIQAIFEGVAFEHRSHVERLLAGRPSPDAVRFAGGAARSRPWLETFAAVLNRPIETSVASELGALGAAVLAAAAAGLHPGLDEAVRAMTAVERRIEPDPRRVAVLARRYENHQALKGALAPLWGRLSDRQAMLPQPAGVAPRNRGSA